MFWIKVVTVLTALVLAWHSVLMWEMIGHSALLSVQAHMFKGRLPVLLLLILIDLIFLVPFILLVLMLYGLMSYNPIIIGIALFILYFGYAINIKKLETIR